MPNSTRNAITIIWISLGLGVIATVIDRLIGKMELTQFCVYIIEYAICVIFPYKLARQSNATRWVWTVMCIAGLLFVIGGMDISKTPPFTMAASWISIPMDIAICYFLFSKESNEWFNRTA